MAGGAAPFEVSRGESTPADVFPGRRRRAKLLTQHSQRGRPGDRSDSAGAAVENCCAPMVPELEYALAARREVVTVADFSIRFFLFITRPSRVNEGSDEIRRETGSM